jgi:hypothetical protein
VSANHIEALAKALYENGNPQHTAEDRAMLGPFEELDLLQQTIWIDLANAAHNHMSERIAIPDGWELRESAQLEEVSRVRQRDLEASQATTARWRARAEIAENTIVRVCAVEAEYLDPEDTDIECREDVWRFIRDLRTALGVA